MCLVLIRNSYFSKKWDISLSHRVKEGKFVVCDKLKFLDTQLMGKVTHKIGGGAGNRTPDTADMSRML